MFLISRLTKNNNLFEADVGVIVNVISSTPSVICGIVSSIGIAVVPVTTDVTLVFTTCTILPPAAAAVLRNFLVLQAPHAKLVCSSRQKHYKFPYFPL